MKIIDARSGEEMWPGKTVQYGGGEWLRLDAIIPNGPLMRLFRVDAKITTAYRDSRLGQIVVRTDVGPLQIRWTHPGFTDWSKKWPFQHIAFIPS